MDVKLVMFKENGERKDFPVQGQRMVIGRGKGCDLRIPLADVSRKHIELRIVPKGLVLTDLGSSNGTYVNNRRVKETGLKAGDHLVVGPVVFTVQIDGEPGSIRPVKTKLERRQRRARAEEQLEVAAASSSSGSWGSGGADMLDKIRQEDPITELEALASGDSGLSGTVLDLDDEDLLQS